MARLLAHRVGVQGFSVGCGLAGFLGDSAEIIITGAKRVEDRQINLFFLLPQLLNNWLGIKFAVKGEKHGYRVSLLDFGVLGNVLCRQMCRLLLLNGC